MKALLLLLALQSDDELRDLASKVKDYPTKFKLIEIGRPAVPHLLAQLTSQDRTLVFESQSALRWIVSRKGGVQANDLLPHAQQGKPKAVRVFAIELLGDLDDVGKLGDLIADDEVRPEVCASLARTKDPFATAILAGALTSDAVAADVLPALGARRDRKHTKTLVYYAAKKDARIRAAAYRGLGLCGDPAAAETLIQAAKDKDDVLPESLLQLAADCEGETAILLCAGAYTRSKDAAGKTRAMIELSRRVTKTEQFEKLAEMAADDDPEIREQAMAGLVRAMDRIGAQDTAYRFILENSRDEGTLILALTGCAQLRAPTLVGPVSKFLTSDRANLRTTAIVVLRDIPGEEASKALIELARKADPALQKVLVDVFADRGDAACATVLREWAEAGNAAAVRAYVRVAATAKDDQAREIYLWALGKGAPEAFDGLARVGDASCLAALEAKLEGETRAAALDAIVAIGDRLAAAGKRDEAIRAYTSAVNAGAPVENKLRILGEKIEITARGGRIDAWWILGPFDAANQEAWERAEAPEKDVDLSKEVKTGRRTLRWQPVQSGDADGIVDLDTLLSPNDYVFAYAFAEVHVTKAREAILRCGSDDGIRVWVNGELVHTKYLPRGLSVDEDTAKIRLKEGKNTILVKICELGGGWGFHMRLEDDQQRPLKFKIR